MQWWQTLDPDLGCKDIASDTVYMWCISYVSLLSLLVHAGKVVLFSCHNFMLSSSLTKGDGLKIWLLSCYVTTCLISSPFTSGPLHGSISLLTMWVKTCIVLNVKVCLNDNLSWADDTCGRLQSLELVCMFSRGVGGPNKWSPPRELHSLKCTQEIIL